MRIRAWIANGALITMGGTVALCLAELGVRMVGPEKRSDRGAPGLYQHDTLLGWTKVPDAEVFVESSEYATTIRTNSHGLRGPEHRWEHGADTTRVLLLGDSFVEGYTVADDHVCSRVLEETLTRRFGGRYEVINAGTAGYSTDQEFLYFERDGVRYAPDVTVLFFYVNDVWFNTRTEYWRGYKPRFVRTADGLVLDGVPVPQADTATFAFAIEGGQGVVAAVRQLDAWLGQRSALYQLARDVVRNSPMLSGLAIRLGVGAVPGEFRPWSRQQDPELDEAWQVTGELLASLDSLARHVGSEFLVFWVPSRPVVYDDDWVRTRRKYAMDDAEWRPAHDGAVLRDICRSRGIRCVVAPERFREEAARVANRGSRLYFTHDGHWTAEGHRVAAEILADEMGQLGAVGVTATRPRRQGDDPD